MTVACDGHVHERAVLQQLVEHVGQVALVIVPSQAELLVTGAGRGRGRGGRTAASSFGRRSFFGAVARLHNSGVVAAGAVGGDAETGGGAETGDGVHGYSCCGVPHGLPGPLNEPRALVRSSGA